MSKIKKTIAMLSLLTSTLVGSSALGTVGAKSFERPNTNINSAVAAVNSPKATITKTATVVDYKKSFTITLKGSDAENAQYVGRDIALILIIASKPDYNDDPSATFLNYFETDPFKLETTTDQEVVTVNDVPLIFEGDNYISCAVFDYATTDTHSCGGDANPYVLQIANNTGTTPVYRFYSSTNQSHFFTSNPDEAAIIDNDYPNEVFNFEGVSFFATSAKADGSCNGTGKSQVYRFYNASVQHHFFTINAAEKDSLIVNNKAWAFEGTAYCADTTQVANTTPVFRFFKAAKTTHFFTTNAAEKDKLIATDSSWKYEDVSYYAQQ